MNSASTAATPNPTLLSYDHPIRGESTDRSRRIKLLHIQLFPMLSGVQRVSLEEFRLLDPKRYEIHLVTCADGPLCEAARKYGVRCHHFPRLMRSISPLNDYRTFKMLRHFMRHERFDIVHSHSSKTGVLGRLAAHASNVPAVVHTVHGFAFPSANNPLTRWMYQLCETKCGSLTDALICLNEEDERISRESLKVPSTAIYRIANGVAPDVYRPFDGDVSPADQRQHLLPGDPARPAVIMIGRLWRQKNPLAFVRAAVIAIEQGCPANFYLAGEGEYRQEIESLIASHDLADRIHLLGWRDDVERLLPLMDTVVLPSRWEGMPLVLLESQACAVPVIASDIPGNRNCIREGVDGFLVPLDDDQVLAERIHRLVSDTQLRQKFGQAGRQKVVQHHDVRQRVKQVVHLYDQLLASRCPR
ncbi:glycosyltransferase family 4 protein [Crateriforma conspicua]|uniref:glycosyltransferase family 4 protein n=1 Tax=Crateriforma conspicua TaxID=2527996 RepID=UPI00118A7507|nr:glycosyltransferase family 4 protein [Crateriforma conspicua]QDV65957.1 Putative glycosyltransferase EpsD [Crateriforma conspicua]